jgi:hypothetical protein
VEATRKEAQEQEQDLLTEAGLKGKEEVGVHSIIVVAVVAVEKISLVIVMAIAIEIQEIIETIGITEITEIEIIGITGTIETEIAARLMMRVETAKAENPEAVMIIVRNIETSRRKITVSQDRIRLQVLL